MAHRVKRVARLIDQAVEGMREELEDAIIDQEEASEVSEGADLRDDDTEEDIPVGKKGARKRGGRKAGVPNRITTALKECILMAATLEGSDRNGKDGMIGYLRSLSRKEPRAFAALLGRVVPLHITGGVEHRHRVLRSADDVKKELEARGLPIDMVYNTDLDRYEPTFNKKHH